MIIVSSLQRSLYRWNAQRIRPFHLQPMSDIRGRLDSQRAELRAALVRKDESGYGLSWERFGSVTLQLRDRMGAIVQQQRDRWTSVHAGGVFMLE